MSDAGPTTRSPIPPETELVIVVRDGDLEECSSIAEAMSYPTLFRLSFELHCPDSAGTRAFRRGPNPVQRALGFESLEVVAADP